MNGASKFWPVGFDNFKNTPAWAMTNMTTTQKQLLSAPGYPTSYLRQRLLTLEKYLILIMAENCEDQGKIDKIAASVERLRLLADPRGTTVAWLRILLH